MLVFTAFRTVSGDKVHTRLMKEFIKRAETVKRIVEQADKSNNPQAAYDLPVSIFYTYTNCRLPKNQRYKSIFLSKNLELESEKFLNAYLDDIMENFEKLSNDAIFRFVTAMHVSNLTNYYEVYNKIEQRILENTDHWFKNSSSFV